MVFCGKASLSCKNCRIRRIKCNKLQPECSQCTRAGKKCPGYRDQLSLMFRDETVKVRSKFQEIPHGGGPVTESPSASTPAVSTDGSATLPDTPEASASCSRTLGRGRTTSRSGSSQDGGPAVKDEDGDDRRDDRRDGGNLAWVVETSREDGRPRLAQKQAPSSLFDVAAVGRPSPLAVQPQTTIADRGQHFYIKSYIFGQPHEPLNAAQLAVEYPWLFHPATSPLVSAVGLVAMANLTGDKQLREVSRQHYLSGLQQTNQSLMNARLQNMDITIRAIVLMAMFEVVRGDNESFDIATLHVKGAAALIRNFLPLLPPSSQPFRSLMQYCYSMLIPCYATGTRVPPIILEYITAGLRSVPASERLFAELLVVAADIINVSAHVRSHVLVDGLAATTGLAVRARQLDARLAVWERDAHASAQWQYEECQTTVLPLDACFRGRFHRYVDMPTARIWSYYRWVRILNSELLLDLTDRCPQSVEAAMRATVEVKFGEDLDPERPGASCPNKPEYRDEGAEGGGGDESNEHHDAFGRLRASLLRVIRRTAEETMVSTPTFWRHPRLSADEYQVVATPATAHLRRGGAGAVGLPPLLFHLQAAGCARGVPEVDWQWALTVVDTIWAQLGMGQARTIAEGMQARRRGPQHMTNEEV